MKRAEQHERLRRAVAEVAKGRSCAEVAKELGHTASWLHNACCKAGVSTVGWKAIQAAKIANLYREGMSIDDLAKQFDLNPQYVRQILRQLGIKFQKKRGRPPSGPTGRAGMQYAHLDWTKQDCILAKEVGISRERIRQVRKLLGKPKSPTHWQATKPSINAWPEGDIAKLGKYTDRQTAEMIGRTPGSVASMRNNRGIPAVKGQHPSARWKPEYEALLGTMLDKQMAQLAGVTPHTAFMWRYRRGIPAHRKHWREWTDEQLAMLGKVSDSEIRRRTGIGMLTIGNKRRELGIAPLYQSFNPRSRRNYGQEYPAGSTHPHQVSQQGVRGALHGPPPQDQKAAGNDAVGAAPEQEPDAQVPRVGEVHLLRQEEA